MVEQFIQMPADSTGKKVRVLENTIGANVVETEVLTLADSTGNALISGANPLPTSQTGALPAGTNIIGALSANQSTNLAQVGGTGTVTGGIAGALGIGGLAASGTAKSGNPSQIGGVFNTTQPTVLTGQVVEAQYTARGGAIVSTGSDAFNITVSTALPTGTNVIGAVTQSGVWNIGTVTTLSQLPTTAALADATANPTLTEIAVFPLGFNGTTWDRLKATGGALNVGITGANTVVANAGTGNFSVVNPAGGVLTTQGNVGNSDALTPGADINTNSFSMGFNGTSWDRIRTTGTGILTVSQNGTWTVQQGTTGAGAASPWSVRVTDGTAFYELPRATPRTASDTLTAAGFSTSVSLDGLQGAAFRLTFAGTITTLDARAQVSVDGGTNWQDVDSYNISTETVQLSIASTTAADYSIYVPGGASNVRVNVVTLTGTIPSITIGMRATHAPTIRVHTAWDRVTGSSLPPHAVLIGASDGTNLQPLQVDVSKFLKVTIAASPATVPVSGTVTSNIGTTGGLLLDATFTGRLPATAALADATANPTLTQAQVFPMGFNGTTWDRLQVDASKFLKVNIAGQALGTVTIAGTVTANAGTGNFNIIGTTASNTAAGNALQALAGQFNTTLPTVTSGNAVFLQTDSSGRTILVGAGIAGTSTGGVVSIQGVTSGTTVPVSGTVTANQGTAAAQSSRWPVFLTDGTTAQVFSAAQGQPGTIIANQAPYVRDILPGVESTNNSSTTALGVSAVFTGTSDDLSSFQAVTVTVLADQISAVSGISIQFSPDNTNWDFKFLYPWNNNTGAAIATVANQAYSITLNKVARFFRVVYTNGGTAQVTFRLKSVLHPVIHRENTTTNVPQEGTVSGNATLTTTTAAAIIAAPGAGVRIYLTSLTASNTSATATRVDFQDGATIFMSFLLAASGGGVTHTFSAPKRMSINTAFQGNLGTAVTDVRVSGQGYIAP